MTNEECGTYLKALRPLRVNLEELSNNLMDAVYVHASGYAATGYASEGYAAMRKEDNDRCASAKDALGRFLSMTLYPMLGQVCVRSKRKSKLRMYVEKKLHSRCERELHKELEEIFSLLHEAFSYREELESEFHGRRLGMRYVDL